MRHLPPSVTSDRKHRTTQHTLLTGATQDTRVGCTIHLLFVSDFISSPSQRVGSFLWAERRQGV